MNRVLAKIWKLLHFPPHIQVAIMRLFQDSYLIGVTGIIFDDKSNILLVKHTYRGQSWSLPGGYIKAKEHPHQALEREIFEETALTISADKRMRIKTDTETSRLDITYMGVFIGGEFHPSAEVSEAKFFTFDAIPLIPRDQLVVIEQALKERQKE